MSNDHTTTTTTTTVIEISVVRFWVLIGGLLALLMGCLVCSAVALFHQPLSWYLPITMAVLVAQILLLLASCRKEA